MHLAQWYRAAVLLATVIAGRHCFAQTPSTSTKTDRRIYISLQARHIDGTPINDLLPRQVELTANGQALPVQLMKGFPSPSPNRTEVLILIAPAAQAQAATVLSRKLPAVFSHERIALATADGRHTPFQETRAELLAAWTAAPASSPGYTAALGQLGDYAGRRAIVVFGPKNAPLPKWIERSANRLRALVYQVGGDTFGNYITTGEREGTPGAVVMAAAPSPVDGAPGAVTTGTSWVIYGTPNIRLVHAERSLHDALRDIRTDGSGYYTLVVDAQPNTSLSLGLRLGRSYQLSAQPYTLDNTPAPELKLAH